MLALLPEWRVRCNACVFCCSQEVHVEDHAHNLSCAYDRVFDSHSAQDEVYQHVKDTAEHVVDGFNSTLYGGCLRWMRRRFS